MEYQVEITETLQRVVPVHATSRIDAETKVRQMYRSCDIVLDGSDCIDVDFRVKKQRP